MMRRPNRFVCPICHRSLPDYFRAVPYSFPIAIANTCFECQMDYEHACPPRTRDGHTPTPAEVARDRVAGYTVEEIATINGVSPRTVFNVLRCGREQIRAGNLSVVA